MLKYPFQILVGVYFLIFTALGICQWKLATFGTNEMKRSSVQLQMYYRANIAKTRAELMDQTFEALSFTSAASIFKA